MKIGIIGTRGIPNHYGGFEQFAEDLSTFLVKKECEVYVYNSSNHPYKKNSFKNVNIIHCEDYEKRIGTIGQFFYDLNCILDSRKRNYDIILQLGYTSSSIWSFLFPKKALIITNMDGLEWKRSKYHFFVKRFLKFAESLAVKHSDFLISDSKGIKAYIDNKYKKESKYIAYGSKIVSEVDNAILKKYNIQEFEYNMLIARIEPENNIETILDGVVLSNDKRPFLVVGDYLNNKFGRKIKDKFKTSEAIIFLGSIYNSLELNTLKNSCELYFHGHSVGGTNPSLLEAMGAGNLIIAHNNLFNKAILEEDGYFFTTSQEVCFHLLNRKRSLEESKIENNREKIKNEFNIEKINNNYLSFFYECIEKNK